MCTLIHKDRINLQRKLRKYNIETNQVHFRNDRYSIFKKFVKGKKFPNMDKLEDNYFVLPLNFKISVYDAKFICKTLKNLL